MKFKTIRITSPRSYLIIKLDVRLGGWEAVLKYRPAIFSSIIEEKIDKYDSGTYQTKVTTRDVDIITAIKAIGKFKLSIISEKKFYIKNKLSSNSSITDKSQKVNYQKIDG